jgi:VanZ family protein
MWTWLPLLAYAAGIIALSSRPAEKLPPPPFWQADKLVHMAIYSLLGALGGRAAARSGLGRGALLVLFGCIGFGLFDEWYQQLIPGRSSDLLDALADAIGASAGFLLVLRYHRARHVPRHSPVR